MIKQAILTTLLAVAVLIGSGAFYIEMITDNSNVDVSDYPSLVNLQTNYSTTGKAGVHARLDTHAAQVRDSTDEIVLEGSDTDLSTTSLWSGAWNTLKLSYNIGGIINDLFTDLVSFFPYTIPSWAIAISITSLFILLAFAIIEGVLRHKL